MKLFLALPVLASVLFAPLANANITGLRVLKIDPVAANGSCLNVVNSPLDAHLILARNGVQVAPAANPSQVVTLAIAVLQIERLSGGPGGPVAGLTVAFPKKRPFSRLATPTLIEMGRNFNDHNVAHISHEIGHYAGTHGLYAPYYRRVPPCKLTGYSHAAYSAATKRNEEFAEVWAAFLTRPELLYNSKAEACRRAYDFFLEAFRRGKELARCDAKNLR